MYMATPSTHTYTQRKRFGRKPATDTLRVSRARNQVEPGVMQFSTLRYFLETLGLRSIRRAAEVLYVAPSANLARRMRR